MKALGLIGLVMVAITTSALAQGAPPKVGDKLIVQVKPKSPMGCKLVGMAKGIKIWAGDCTDAAEMRGSAPAAEAVPAPSLPAQAAGAIPPGQKQ